MKYINKIIALTIPNVKEMELIEKYGLLLWLCAWVVKIAAILFILWFCISVLGFHIGIGH